MSSFTNGLAFKQAIFEATKTIMQADEATADVYVCPGTPGTYKPADIISFGRLSVAQAPANLGTRRSREETLTVEVTLSCFIGGDDSGELPSQVRAFELLGLIERHVRVTDTTLGGVVRHCFLTNVETDGATPEEYTAQGRAVDVVATFTAQNRVTE
ncbi:hypothetical protein [Paeniglutamicibacter sp.]|uniref:hypothetical protein n=1 Tax=Paeniglutamicibacter sp. TaxID=1934391 RepID=UPI003988EC43